ncbi:hypothetical protein K8R47_01690 [archaeon]|nr:hypothetical protein [archaeon]
MNKKGIFLPIFSLVMFIILVTIFVFVSSSQGVNENKAFGSNQYDLISLKNDANEDLFNLNQVVKYSLHKTVKEFSENSGVGENCDGKWEFNSVDCDPENLEKNLLELVGNNLKNYDIETYELSDDNVLGSVKDFVYELDKDEIYVKYEMDVNFNQEIPLDIVKILNLRGKIKECLENKEDLKNCVNEDFTEDSLGILHYTIENNKSIMMFTDKLDYENIAFEFNIDPKNSGVNIF